MRARAWCLSGRRWCTVEAVMQCRRRARVHARAAREAVKTHKRIARSPRIFQPLGWRKRRKLLRVFASANTKENASQSFAVESDNAALPPQLQPQCPMKSVGERRWLLAI